MTTFPSTTDHGGTRFAMSRDELVLALSTPTDEDGLLHARDIEKDDLPLFAMASFENDYVCGEGVEHAYALGFDVDEAPVPTKDTLRALGAAGVFFPSSSSTPSAPRWRLLLWISRPVTGAEYYTLWSFVSGRFPFPVGQAAKDPSRGWYVPREPADGPFELHTIPGVELDVDVLLAIAPAVTPPTYEDEGDELGVPPVDISTPLGRDMVARATAYLKTEALPCVSGQGGQDRAFRVAMRLMRGYRLPLDAAAALWIEHYNDRCDPAWEEHEIDRKLAHARDRASGPTGLPSPGFLESWSAPPGVKELLRAPRRSIAEINTTRRRVKRADHTYTHTGGEQTRSDAKKVEVNELIHAFTTLDSWAGVWQYDEFRKALRAVEPPVRLDAETTGLSEEDVTLVATWFRANGMLAPKDAVRDAIRAAAKMCKFHPIREYMASLPEVAPADARAFLDALPGRVLGVDAEHARVWFTKWLVSAVRRILTPGVKADAMMVWFGGQGAFKSQLCEILAGEQHFKDELDEMSGRDAAWHLEGVWIYEIAELKALLKSGPTAAKGYLSRRVDKYRAFGNGEKVEHARQCVFIGTTNVREFLVDATGDRRYWPIGLAEDWLIPLAWVSENRDRIWASALALALLPTSKERPDLVSVGGTFDHWTSREEDAALSPAKSEFQEEDPWVESLRDACAGCKSVSNSGDLYVSVIAAGEEGALARLTPQIKDRISQCMQRLGCKYTTVWLEGRACRGWKVPDALANEVPSAHERRRRAQRSSADESARLASKANGRPS